MIDLCLCELTATSSFCVCDENRLSNVEFNCFGLVVQLFRIIQSLFTHLFKHCPISSLQYPIFSSIVSFLRSSCSSILSLFIASLSTNIQTPLQYHHFFNLITLQSLHFFKLITFRLFNMVAISSSSFNFTTFNKPLINLHCSISPLFNLHRSISPFFNLQTTISFHRFQPTNEPLFIFQPFFNLITHQFHICSLLHCQQTTLLSIFTPRSISQLFKQSSLSTNHSSTLHPSQFHFFKHSPANSSHHSSISISNRVGISSEISREIGDVHFQ